MEKVYSLKGKFDFKIDEKGRIMIPSKLRKQLAGIEQFTIIPSIEKHLILFPIDAFRLFEEKIRSILNEEEKRIMIDYIYSNAEDINCDSQGRIVIPRQLLIHASITDDILIVGGMDRIYLWNPNLFKEHIVNIQKKHKKTLKFIGL